MAFKSIRQSLNIIADHFTSNSLVASSLAISDLVVTNITATASQHLTLIGVTGKDIIAKLTDAAGARKFIIKDSADAEVASIDSDGNIIANKVTAKGPYAESAIAGAPSAATLISAFGAAATVGKGFTAEYKDTTASTGVLYAVGCDGANYWAVPMVKAA